MKYFPVRLGSRLWLALLAGLPFAAAAAGDSAVLQVPPNDPCYETARRLVEGAIARSASSSAEATALQQFRQSKDPFTLRADVKVDIDATIESFKGESVPLLKRQAFAVPETSYDVTVLLNGRRTRASFRMVHEREGGCSLSPSERIVFACLDCF